MCVLKAKIKTIQKASIKTNKKQQLKQLKKIKPLGCAASF